MKIVLASSNKHKVQEINDIVKTKCGIVSYWAVHGRSDVSFKRRLQRY